MFCCWEEKRTGLTGYNINKTNLNASHVQNWFGLVFLAEPCFNSFDRTSSLVLRYSIVLSLYKCNTTRMVRRNRTNRAQYTSLQIKNKHNTIQKQIHIRISLKLLIYQAILHLIKLLQLNTTAILDLPSYSYVKCIS